MLDASWKTFIGLLGVMGPGVCMRSGIGSLVGPWTSSLLGMLRKDLGASLDEGCFRNLDSLPTEVGRSSNRSSSVPSPKLRLREGLVTVFLAAASRASADGARSARLDVRDGVSGTKAEERREYDRGGGDCAR